MSRPVVRASYLIFYQIIFRFLLTLYKWCNHHVDTLILRFSFFFFRWSAVPFCTCKTCNFHINLRHISAVVVIFFLFFLVMGSVFSDSFSFLSLSFLMWNPSRYFIELRLYSLRSNRLNITNAKWVWQTNDLWTG